MKISQYKYDVLTTTLCNKMFDKEVNVLRSTFHGEYIEFGVNWSAKGTVDAVEALCFADLIKEAGVVCHHINRLQIETVIKEDEKEHTTEEYYKDIETLKKLLKPNIVREQLIEFLEEE